MLQYLTRLKDFISVLKYDRISKSNMEMEEFSIFFGCLGFSVRTAVVTVLQAVFIRHIFFFWICITNSKDQRSLQLTQQTEKELKSGIFQVMYCTKIFVTLCLDELYRH